VTELEEHPEELPAASVAVALRVVEELSPTETVSPGEAKLAALSVAARFGLVQSPVVGAL
jgi:hypothetical protein